jgi:hypothetical protein
MMFCTVSVRLFQVSPPLEGAVAALPPKVLSLTISVPKLIIPPPPLALCSDCVFPQKNRPTQIARACFHYIPSGTTRHIKS